MTLGKDSNIFVDIAMWITKEFLNNFTPKREAHREWKQGQVTWDKYRETIQAARDQVKKAEALIKLNLAKDTSGERRPGKT